MVPNIQCGNTGKTESTLSVQVSNSGVFTSNTLTTSVVTFSCVNGGLQVSSLLPETIKYKIKDDDLRLVLKRIGREYASVNEAKWLIRRWVDRALQEETKRERLKLEQLTFATQHTNLSMFDLIEII